jgi:toxin ParE1/3/4
MIVILAEDRYAQEVRQSVLLEPTTLLARGWRSKQSCPYPYSYQQAGALTVRVARLELAPDVLDDFDRFLDHLARSEVVDASLRIAEIVQAVQILTHSSLIGRSVKDG